MISGRFDKESRTAVITLEDGTVLRFDREQFKDLLRTIIDIQIRLSEQDSEDRKKQVLLYVKATPGCSKAEIAEALFPDDPPMSIKVGIALAGLIQAGKIQMRVRIDPDDKGNLVSTYVYSPIDETEAKA